MSYVSTQAKLYAASKKLGRKKTNYKHKIKTIADCEETTFGGTLILTKEQIPQDTAMRTFISAATQIPLRKTRRQTFGAELMYIIIMTTAQIFQKDFAII